MNKILFDIGNSFVKWATVEDDYYEPQTALNLAEILKQGLDILGLDYIPDEVYFCSVADKKQVGLFKAFIQNEWQLIPTQLSSQQACCGLRSGYGDFSSLGDDRWMAMLGAIEEYKQPVIVIDAGTAITVDAVVDGKHLGGFIVPGLGLQRASLSINTGDLDEYDNPDDADSSSVLATDTASAILGGTLYMTAAFLNQLIIDLRLQFNNEFTVLLTGGDALHLSAVLDAEVVVIPDLVLRGMLFAEETIKNA